MKIAISGPESTGKTTLAKALVAHYDCAYVSEYARSYLEQLDRPYTEEDLQQIAVGQMAAEDSAEYEKMVVCDTDILTLKIWSQEKFGSVDEIIQKAYINSHYDHTFLMIPDFPWVYDPMRESEHDRERLFETYFKSLKLSNSKFSILRGTNEDRLALAIKEIEKRILLS